MSAKTAQAPTAEKAAAVRPAAAVTVQRLPARVSSPKDPAEKEAEATAKKVVRMAAPQSPYISRFADTGVFSRQREAEGQPRVTGSVASEIQGSMAGGSPLPSGVRGFMEPRFRADFGKVRVHTGEKAARLSAGLQAQAFTVGSHVFFGRDKFRPESPEGRELIAHELTHTIQQGGAVQRSEDVSVTQSSPVQVQRLSLGAIADRLANWANAIPGFRMFTIVLGVNPINMSRADRSPANILRAVVEFLPGGVLITRALDSYGVFDRVGNWVEQQIRTLGITGDSIRRAISEFADSLGLSDLWDIGGVFSRARRIFTDPIDRIIAFVRNLAAGILRFIREAILRPLANLASRTPAWDLLRAVLGRDPITGDPYPRNADTLIGGFMKLINQEEVWNNLKRANAVARAWAWFQSALAELIGFVREIPTLFLQALQALQIQDLADLPGAFARVGRVFAGFVGRFISWGLGKVLNLLEIIFEVLAPAVVPYLRRAAGAFRTIIQNPIGFIGNLVRAGLVGFRQFATNFLTHLRASLIGWLTGTLSGANIYIPQAFTLREIIKFVLSVLGLTWQNIRQKLVRVIGETAVGALETGFDIVMTLVTQGPAAAWERIQESLSNLRDIVMEQIMTFVRDRVVQAAITRLVTSLNPAGAFIQAIIAIYNTIMFFVERLRQIAQVAAAFIDSIAAIASGVIAAAANRVEQTMAGLLTLVISFLARIAGLGRVSDAVTNIVNRVRAPIDRALDRVVDWIVAQARRLGRLVVGGAGRGDTRTPQEKQQALQMAMAAATQEARRPGVSRREIERTLQQLRARYRLGVLAAEPMGRDRWRIHGVVNPEVYSEPLPDRMTEEEAVVALRGRQSEIRVASLAIARRVIQRVFGRLALEAPEPGPAAGPASRVTTRGGVTEFEGGYTGQAETMSSFRTMKERLLVYHVDTRRFNVNEIGAWFEQERGRLRTGIETANANMRRQTESVNPNSTIINALTANLVSFRNRLQELDRLEANFNANLPAYRRLEQEGVLYGHQGLTRGHPHRRVPHINLEGRIHFGTPEMEYIDATIYIAR